MSKISTLFALITLLVTTATAQTKPAGESLNLSDHTWPPYFFEGRGFARELLETCLPPAGYEPKFASISIEQVYAGLRSGFVDGHVFSYRKDREAFLVFGKKPLFRDAYRPAVQAGKGIVIKELSDFDGLRLGHLEGLRYSEDFLSYVQEQREAGNVIVAKDNEELQTLLLSGRIDVFVNLASTTTWTSQQTGAREKIQILPYDVKSSDYFFALSKASRKIKDLTGLLEEIDRCLQAMRQDGRYQRLADDYELE